jgi:DNA-binding NarL/FixJ family response regulator
MEREYLAALIDGTPGMSCVRAYGGVPEVLELLPKDRPDTVLLAIEGADGEGANLIRRLHAALPRVPVLVMVSNLSASQLFRVLEAGVSGCLEKPCSPDQIVRAIVLVHEGGAAVSGQVAQKILEFFEARGRSMQALSVREREVLTHLAQGLKPPEIAAQLRLSSDTLRTHVRNILEKLDVHSKAEAIAKYLNPLTTRDNHTEQNIQTGTLHHARSA